MAKTAHERRRQPRLIWIDLPRVQIEGDWLSLAPVHRRDAASRPGVWQKPEIAAAADRQVLAAQTHRRTGQLPKRPRRPRNHIRVTGRARDAVPIMADWENAGVVEIPFLDQHVKSP